MCYNIQNKIKQIIILVLVILLNKIYVISIYFVLTIDYELSEVHELSSYLIKEGNLAAIRSGHLLIVN